jgi:hypothetical protein
MEWVNMNGQTEAITKDHGKRDNIMEKVFMSFQMEKFLKGYGKTDIVKNLLKNSD